MKHTPKKDKFGQICLDYPNYLSNEKKQQNTVEKKSQNLIDLEIYAKNVILFDWFQLILQYNLQIFNRVQYHENLS